MFMKPGFTTLFFRIMPFKAFLTNHCGVPITPIFTPNFNRLGFSL